MLQKELAKRLRGRFETEMDGDGWLAVSSDGMPLCRVKYNGNCIVNDNPYLSEEYLGKIAEVQNELLTVLSVTQTIGRRDNAWHGLLQNLNI